MPVSSSSPVCVLLIWTPVAGSPSVSGTSCFGSKGPQELTRWCSRWCSHQEDGSSRQCSWNGHHCHKKSKVSQHKNIEYALRCCIRIVERFLHLAQGLIFKASPRLIQKPAPPVANQKLTGLCNGETKASVSIPNAPFNLYNQCVYFIYIYKYKKLGYFGRPTILLSPSLSVASIGLSKLGFPMYCPECEGSWTATSPVSLRSHSCHHPHDRTT